MAAAKGRSLEETPTWAVAIVCFVLVAISILIEHALHLMGKWLTKRNKRALYEALEKIKSELMLLGFLSLLLTVGQGPISEICVSKALADTWHPCTRKAEEEKYKDTYGGTGNDVHKGRRRLLASAAFASLDSNQSHRRVLAAAGYDKCASQGKVPFVSAYAIHELHIFIFVLAVFHVLYCITTLALGRAKMRKWKSWERETKTTEYQFSHDPERFRFARDTSFGRRHLSFWSSSPILLWIVCFFRQFVRSVRKVDYFTLRHGFIIAHLAPQSQHNFDFQKYISRSLDEDFKVVVGISPPIWFFAVVFLLFNTHGWHSYLWLPFVPLVIILLVGSKLQVIITKMGLSIEQRGEVVKGTPLVQPGDDLFWFNWPRLILYLINFVLFQNAFQLAFFAFAWYKFGLRSCFHEKTEDIIIRVSMGLLIQILCSYVTLPLYALVTQMGSTMKPTVFNDRVAKALHSWHQTAKKHIKQQRQSGSISPLTSTPPHGSSPTHLLRYYRNETDSVDTFARVSNFDRQLLETEGSVSPSRNLEEMPCSQANPNHDIEKEEKNDNEMNSESSVPRTHLFQHGINIHSSDFSFDKS